MSGLRTSSFMPRVSEACNFAHMLAPMEQDGVLETTVPAARLDAASTAGDASSWSLESCEREPEAAPRPMMHSTSDPLPFCGALKSGRMPNQATPHCAAQQAEGREEAGRASTGCFGKRTSDIVSARDLALTPRCGRHDVLSLSPSLALSLSFLKRPFVPRRFLHAFFFHVSRETERSTCVIRIQHHTQTHTSNSWQDKDGDRGLVDGDLGTWSRLLEQTASC